MTESWNSYGNGCLNGTINETGVVMVLGYGLKQGWELRLGLDQNLN